MRPSCRAARSAAHAFVAVGVEEVDDVGLDCGLDLGGELVESPPVATADARARARLGESPDDGRPEIPGAAGHCDARVRRVLPPRRHASNEAERTDALRTPRIPAGRP